MIFGMVFLTNLGDVWLNFGIVWGGSNFGEFLDMRKGGKKGWHKVGGAPCKEYPC